MANLVSTVNFLILCRFVTTEAVGIISQPLSVNVTTGSTASFECVTNGGPLYWLVNNSDDMTRWGGEIIDSTRQTESGSGQVSTLQIRATEGRNNTEIRCAVHNVRSNIALLLIQGLLNAPTNVSVSSGHESILFLLWEEPFTLDLTNTEQDLYYNVLITNVNSGANIVYNSTIPSFIFHKGSSRRDLCSKFKFQIAAVNSVGVGQRSAIVEGNFGFNSSPHLTNSSFHEFTCSSSCSVHFITWFLNQTLLNENYFPEVRYNINSDKKNRCFNSNEGNFTEHLQFFMVDTETDLSLTTISCASHIVCNEIEIHETCTPSVCYSKSNTVDFKDFVAESTTEPKRDIQNITDGALLLPTTKTRVTDHEDNKFLLQSIISGLVVAMIVLIVMSTIIIVVTCVHFRKQARLRTDVLNEIHLSQERANSKEVIYDEPKSLAFSFQQELAELQQCPAYQTVWFN